MEFTEKEKEILRKKEATGSHNCSEHDSLEEHIKAFAEYFEGEFSRKDMFFLALSSCDQFGVFETELIEFEEGEDEGNVQELREQGSLPDNIEFIRWTFDYGEPKVSTFYCRNEEGFLSSKGNFYYK